MTRNHTLTLAGTLMAIALISAAPASAQGVTPPATGERMGPPPGGMDHHGPMMGRHPNPPSVDERVQRMSGELNLTTDQAARVKALLTAQQRSADSLRAVHAVQMQAEMKAMEARRAEHEKAMMAILTPEQRVKHEALMKMHRGPDGRGGPGGPRRGMRGDHRGPGDEGSRR